MKYVKCGYTRYKPHRILINSPCTRTHPECCLKGVDAFGAAKVQQWNAAVGVWNLQGTGESSQMLVGRLRGWKVHGGDVSEGSVDG